MKYLLATTLVFISALLYAQNDDFEPARFYINLSGVGAFPTEDFKDKAQAGDGYGLEADFLYDISKNGFLQIGLGVSYLLQATQTFDQTVNIQGTFLDVETTVDNQIVFPFVKTRLMARPQKRFSPFATVALGARSFSTTSRFSYYAEPTFLETLFGVEDEEHTVSNKEYEDWSFALELAGGLTYNLFRNLDLNLLAFRTFGGETSYIDKNSIWQDGPDAFTFETTTSKTNMWGLKLGVTILLY